MSNSQQEEPVDPKRSLTDPTNEPIQKSLVATARARVEYWTGGRTNHILTLGALALVGVYAVLSTTNGTSTSTTPQNTASIEDVSSYRSGVLHDDSSAKNVAVIHMGPHKTGSSTIETYEAVYRDELKEDDYELPFLWVLDIWDGEAIDHMEIFANQVQFATCFIPPDDFSRIRYPCIYELLLAALEIAAEGKNTVISAETFDHAGDDGMKALSAYTRAFDETLVTVFYRRYFEWIASVDNQERKDRRITDGGVHGEWLWQSSIVERVEAGYADREVDFTFSSSVVERAEKYFENISIVNMHTDGNFNEDFFCDVMPRADNICNAVRNEEEGIYENLHTDLIWQDLAYAAWKKGMVNVKTDEDLKKVTQAIQEYQEDTLHLTKKDFPMICLSPEAEKWLLQVSLEAEEKLVPEFFKTPLGKEGLLAEFEEKSKFDLCKIDSEKTLEDRTWVQFFKNHQF